MRRSTLLGLFIPALFLACGSERSGAGIGGKSGVESGGGGGGSAGQDATSAAGAAGVADTADGSAGDGNFCGIGGPCIYYRENFDTAACAPGWHLQTWWRCGEPDRVLQPPAKSPESALISLGAGPDGPYAGVASSPAIDLSLAGQPLLEFYLSMKTTRTDQLASGHPFVSGLKVRARVGEEVFELPHVDPIYTGYQMWSESLEYGFARHRVDLSAFSGKVIRLDFEFDSEYEAGDFVMLDDVSVYDASLVPSIPESLAVPRCEPKTTRCAVHLAQVCSQNGTWQTTEDCPYICTEGGSCGGSCRPFESTCDPAHPGTRLVCEGSGLAEVAQTCLDECAAGHCRGVYFDEGFEGPSAPPGWILAGDWAIAPAPGLAPVLVSEDGSTLAGRLTQAMTSRKFADDFAQTPELDLTSATEPVLHFLGYMYTEPGRSGFDVWARSDATAGEWQLLTPEYPDYDGTVNGNAAWSGLWLTFRDAQVDLTQFVGQKLSLRFALASDGTNQGDASVYIEHASVMERPLVPLAIEIPFPSRFYAVTDQPFSATLHAFGGSSRAQWSIVSRTDADWLSIDAQTGTLSGVPSSTDPKLASITVRVEEPGVKRANFSELGLEIEVD
ncbi:MAG TPA: Ig domain-containing protein [Polyangiaceae bacterium]|nr:Ig domain-containing protein [Polyangiaceae bacterium]